MGGFMNKGFTLVELLITMVISGVIMTSVYSAFKSQQDSYLSQEQVAEMQQNLRAGLYVMTEEVRMAGYDVDKNGSKTGTAGISVANAAGITFTFVSDDDGTDNDNADGDNNSSTGADEPGELKTIQYRLYVDADGDTNLGRKVGAASIAAVGENFEAMEFYYTLTDGTQTSTPTTAQLSNISSLEVSILARAASPDRNYTDSRTYPTTPAGTTWGPFGDNFRRRFQTMTVKCRNMGL